MSQMATVHHTRYGVWSMKNEYLRVFLLYSILYNIYSTTHLKFLDLSRLKKIENSNSNLWGHFLTHWSSSILSAPMHNLQFNNLKNLPHLTLPYSRCQKVTDRTLRGTPTTRPGAPTRQELAAIITPTPTGHTTMPTVMGARTTTQAQVVRDQPHTPHQHPPEDHLRVPHSQSEKILNVYGQSRRQQKLKWVPTAAM